MAVFDLIFDIIHAGELVHVVCPKCFHGDYVRLPDVNQSYGQASGMTDNSGKKAHSVSRTIFEALFGPLD